MTPAARSRLVAVLRTLVVLVVGAIVGAEYLGSVWLGLLLGLLVSLGLFLAFESRRGRNQGVNDDDHGVEL